MLGKGLESLIPQKGSNNQNGNTQGNAAAPVASSSNPPIDPARELPDGVGSGAADLRPADELPAGLEMQPSATISIPPASSSITSYASSKIPVTPTDDLTPASKEEITSSPRDVGAHASSVGSVDPGLRRHSPSVFVAAAPRDDRGEVSRRAVTPSHPAIQPSISESIFQIEVEKIEPNPGQPRRVFDEAALRDLAHSIREFGFLQPIVVSRIEKETPSGVDISYQLIAGERRLMAAKILGLRIVPAIVRKVGLEREKLELAIIENIQRENLNPLETARAFQRLQEEFRMTQREIAAKMGKSREAIANTVRLLDLPVYVQDALGKGELSESHARMLLAIDDPGAQKRLFDEILENGLTTRDVKERVKAMTKPRPYHHHMTTENLPPEVKAMQETLSQSLGAPVEIQKTPADNGKITITFYSAEELENILRRLGKEGE
jgi:ParB family chromosome partitioning protein